MDIEQGVKNVAVRIADAKGMLTQQCVSCLHREFHFLIYSSLPSIHYLKLQVTNREPVIDQLVQ